MHSAENGVRYLAKNNEAKKSGENLARNPWNLGKFPCISSFMEALVKSKCSL